MCRVIPVWAKQSLWRTHGAKKKVLLRGVGQGLWAAALNIPWCHIIRLVSWWKCCSKTMECACSVWCVCVCLCRISECVSVHRFLRIWNRDKHRDYPEQRIIKNVCLCQNNWGGGVEREELRYTHPVLRSGSAPQIVY